MRSLHKTILLTLVLLLSAVLTTAGETKDNQNSIFETEHQKIKYDLVQSFHDNSILLAAVDEAADKTIMTQNSTVVKRKSPAKAFGLSLIVPGAGQFYNGSKIKPFVFLGVEVAAWVMNANWNKDGDDMTDVFEQFNRDHWSEDSYRNFLTMTYGVDQEDLVGLEFTEINHTLPSTLTQQYYEMTGKYDQFSWGWDDASLGDTVLGDYNITTPPPRTIAGTIPYSQNRFDYENMRDDANNSYSKARSMIYVSIVNRFISAFEAMIQSKKINKQLDKGFDNSEDTTPIDFDFSLKSKNELFDTPQLVINYRF